jgi:hypothetical protein
MSLSIVCLAWYCYDRGFKNGFETSKIIDDQILSDLSKKWNKDDKEK